MKNRLAPVAISLSRAALFLLGVVPAMGWAGVLHCDIDTGGAAPFSPYTRENPIAADQNTPDYTVLLSLDYAQFLPNMRLTCTLDGQEFDAPATFDGEISLSLCASPAQSSAVSLTALRLSEISPSKVAGASNSWPSEVHVRRIFGKN